MDCFVDKLNGDFKVVLHSIIVFEVEEMAGVVFAQAPAIPCGDTAGRDSGKDGRCSDGFYFGFSLSYDACYSVVGS